MPNTKQHCSAPLCTLNVSKFYLKCHRQVIGKFDIECYFNLNDHSFVHLGWHHFIANQRQCNAFGMTWSEKKNSTTQSTKNYHEIKWNTILYLHIVQRTAYSITIQIAIEVFCMKLTQFASYARRLHGWLLFRWMLPLFMLLLLLLLFIVHRCGNSKYFDALFTKCYVTSGCKCNIWTSYLRVP